MELRSTLRRSLPLVLLGVGSCAPKLSTPPEVIEAVEIAYAVVMNPDAAPCLAAKAADATVHGGGRIQFYARVKTNYREIYTPALPSAWPELCQ